MRKLLMITLLGIAVISSYTQDNQTMSKKEQRKLAREQKKAEKAAADEEAAELTTLMVENHRFVLEADYVGDQTGTRIPVNSNLNFIVIDSAKTTLQLGGYNGIGLNGVGGITVDGRVTKYDLKKLESKRGHSWSLMIYLITSIGNYDITMSVSSLGSADATVRGSVSGQLRYSGNLVPLGLSRVYKGTALP